MAAKYFHLPGDGPVQLSPVWSQPEGGIIFRAASDAAPWGWGAPFDETNKPLGTPGGSYPRMQCLKSITHSTSTLNSTHQQTVGPYKKVYGYKNASFAKTGTDGDGLWNYGANHWVYFSEGKCKGYVSWGIHRLEDMHNYRVAAQYPWVNIKKPWTPAEEYSEWRANEPESINQNPSGSSSNTGITLTVLMSLAEVLGFDVALELGLITPQLIRDWELIQADREANNGQPKPPGVPPEANAYSCPHAKYDLEITNGIYLKGRCIHICKFGEYPVAAAVQSVNRQEGADTVTKEYLVFITATGLTGSGAEYRVYSKPRTAKSHAQAQLIGSFSTREIFPNIKEDPYLVYPHKGRWIYSGDGNDVPGHFNGSGTRCSFVFPVWAPTAGGDEADWTEYGYGWQWEGGNNYYNIWTTCVIHVDIPDPDLSSEIVVEDIEFGHSFGMCRRMMPRAYNRLGAGYENGIIIQMWTGPYQTFYSGRTGSSMEMFYSVDTQMGTPQTVAIDYPDGSDEELRMTCKVTKGIDWTESDVVFNEAYGWNDLRQMSNNGVGTYKRDIHGTRKQWITTEYRFNNRTWNEYMEEYTDGETIDHMLPLGVYQGPYNDPYGTGVNKMTWANWGLQEWRYKSHLYWSRKEKAIRWLAVDLKRDFFAWVESEGAADKPVAGVHNKHAEFSELGGAKIVKDEDWSDETYRGANTWRGLGASAKVIVDDSLVYEENSDTTPSPHGILSLLRRNTYHCVGASFGIFLEDGTNRANYGCSRWDAVLPHPDYGSYDISYPDLVWLPKLIQYTLDDIRPWRPLSCDWEQYVFAAPLQRFCGRANHQSVPYVGDYGKIIEWVWRECYYPYQAVTDYTFPDDPRTMQTLMLPKWENGQAIYDRTCWTRLTHVDDVQAFLEVPGEFLRTCSLGII